MRRLTSLIAALWFLIIMPAWAEAYEVLLLQSSRAPAYDTALKGFRSVRTFSERLIVMSDYAEVDLQRIVREERPLLIVALGDNAYNAARKVRQVPVVVMMAPNFKGSGGHPALTGVEFQLPPDRFLPALQALKAKRVGMISSPAKSGQYVRRVQQSATRYGIDVVVREVNSPREVAGQLATLKGQVDALWLLPDDTAVAREATDAYFLFSMAHQVPTIVFSSAYLPLGAAVVVEADRYDIGRQAGEMASGIINREDINDYPPAAPRKSIIRTNPVVLRRIGQPSDIAAKIEGGQ